MLSRVIKNISYCNLDNSDMLKEVTGRNEYLLPVV